MMDEKPNFRFECQYCRRIVELHLSILQQCDILTCPVCGGEHMVHLTPTRIVIGEPNLEHN
jgi:rRNA maturation endonuclease Nob1